jgi:hypothetical protein
MPSKNHFVLSPNSRNNMLKFVVKGRDSRLSDTPNHITEVKMILTFTFGHFWLTHLFTDRRSFEVLRDGQLPRGRYATHVRHIFFPFPLSSSISPFALIRLCSTSAIESGWLWSVVHFLSHDLEKTGSLEERNCYAMHFDWRHHNSLAAG